MSGAAHSTGFPDAPFVDGSGNLVPVWRQFLIALYRRTGAQAGSDPANVASTADLSAETAAREAADTALGHSIAAETTARIAADAAEAKERQAMDDYIISTSGAAAGLATETAARIAGDNNLEAQKAPLASPTFSGIVAAPEYISSPATVGVATMRAGTETQTGYFEFYNADNVRQGYLGYAATGGPLQLASDTGAGWNVTGPLSTPPLIDAADDAAAAAAGVAVGQFYRNGSVVMQRVV